MPPGNFEYIATRPDPLLSEFVESFWMHANHSDDGKDVVLLPDGNVDVFFTYSASEPLHVFLMRLDSEATQAKFPSKTVIFAISFKLLALEYILHTKIDNQPFSPIHLPGGFLDISIHDLNDFDHFVKKASQKITSMLTVTIDERKRKLFELIYSSNGSLTIKEYSEKSFWSSRQINRYFTQQFGISLKAYCNILRFRASFTQIKKGNLFPEQDFADQAHFIKEIKKFSGVRPKELAKNENDRFIQFSVMPKK